MTPTILGSIVLTLAIHGPLYADDLAARVGCSLRDLAAMAPTLRPAVEAIRCDGTHLLYTRDESGSRVYEARRSRPVRTWEVAA